MVYMNVLQFDVFELVRISLLISYLLKDLGDAIFSLIIVSEIPFGQLLFNCVLSGFPMSLLMPHVHVSNLRLLMCCTLIALVSSALMLGDQIAMQMDIVREV